MHVRRVAVVELALNHAGNVHEFRNEAPENSPIVHYFKRGKNAAPELENGEKPPFILGVGAVGVVDELPGVFELDFKGVARRAPVGLAVLKKPQNARGLALENAPAHRADFAAVRAKPVDFVLSVARNARPQLAHGRQNVFRQAHPHALSGGLGERIDRSERFVDLAHKSLDSLLLRRTRKPEALGDQRLLFEVEDVGRAVRLEVEVVAHPEQKVERAAQDFVFYGGKQPPPQESLYPRGAEVQQSLPAHRLKVAQASDSVFYVGLLYVRSPVECGVAVAL